MSKFIYYLSYIFLKANKSNQIDTRNQINQAPAIAVKPMICLKVCLVQVNESASVMLSQTWHHLLLHFYESTVLSKGYNFALNK